MMRVLPRLPLFLGLSLFLATTAWAQLASQTALVGTVTDSGGAVLPGATIVAVNSGTKDTYEATTNAEGYYNIQFVRPGKYDITVTVPNFQTFKATGVDVATNQVVRTNASLSVGGINESVNVEASAQVLDTDRATISETISERAIVELPLSGRNVWSLASTTPGVLGGLNSDIGLSFRGAGQREIQNSLSLDGINSSSNLLAATSMRPIADAVTEIQVQTGSTSAEYGSYLGVHINVVTKSGTNNLHGAVFDFFQDDALDERGYFENRANPANPRRRQQFGGQVDGPLVIPKLYDGRNKTFFMGAYEGVRAEGLSSSFASVPTALMRQGNFSEVTTAIRNPFTGQPFPGNIIPPSMLYPTALKLLKYYPAPNRPGLSSNLQAEGANTDDIDQFLAPRRSEPRQQGPAERPLQLARQLQQQSRRDSGHRRHQPRVNKNWLVRLHAHAEAEPAQRLPDRLPPHRLRHVEPLRGERRLRPRARISAFPGFDGDVKYSNPGLPSINISNFSGLGGGGTNWYQFDTTFQMSNVMAYTRGSHNVRAGFDLRRMATGRRAANDPRGRFDFTSNISGYSVADFMLGLPRTVIPPTDQIQGHVGRLAQRVLRQRRLAGVAKPHVEPGPALRVEHAGADVRGRGLDAGGRLRNDYSEQQSERLPRGGLQVPRPELQGHRPAPWRHVSPRREDRSSRRLRDLLQPEPDELVHVPDQQPAGGGRDHVHLGCQHAAVAVVLEPVRAGRGRRGAPTSSRRRAICPMPARTSGASTSSVSSGGAPRSTCSTSGRTPATWIAASSTTRRSPVPGTVDARRPSQRYRSRRIIANDLEADYDAVSIILRKRMSHGLLADAHYTWSRTRDMSTHSNGGGQTMDNYDIQRDYGPANWDIPHRFVASYLYDIPFLKNSSQPDPEVRRGRMADQRRDHDPERVAGQHHVLPGPGEHRHHGAPASEPRRRGARAQLPAEYRGHDRPGAP